MGYNKTLINSEMWNLQKQENKNKDFQLGILQLLCVFKAAYS